MAFYSISAEEAATMINNGETVGLSGFSRAGVPKCIIPEIARKAKNEHDHGRPFKINIYTGGSVGDSCDTELSQIDAIDIRIPYASNKELRAKANNNELNYLDINLSDTASQIRKGFLPAIDWGIIEACEIQNFGQTTRIYLTSGIGIAPTICRMAQKGLFIELNHWHSTKIIGMHDIYEMEDYPYRSPIRITHATELIGMPYIEVYTNQIKGVLECNMTDEATALTQKSAVTEQIGQNIAQFLINDMNAGRIPRSFLNLQSGIGSTANAVLETLGNHKDIPNFCLYTEVLQEAPLQMMLEGRIDKASTSCLAVPNDYLQMMYQNMNDFRGRLVLRSTELSNNPEVIARIGLCSLNTALEFDIYGHVNSTKVCGTRMMNGVGGSADFTNNAYLSIFSCGSTAKNGKISSIVPFCSHIDHTEHFVDAIATEYGVADLRGKSALAKAEALIAIAHPDYRPLLQEYMQLAHGYGGHTHHCLSAAFAMHDTLRRKGDMRLTDWGEYLKD